MNVHLESLGCRLNRGEIEHMSHRLAATGHSLVDRPSQAQLCILNTCAVTGAAERKSHQRIRALAQANPATRLAITGCYATLAPTEITPLPQVAWVIPNAGKARLVDQVCGPRTPGAGEDPENPLEPQAHTRAFVKVQDGCDNHCTYCIVRLLRGPSRSRPLSEIVAQVERLVRGGYREVVLTGASLGAYGREQGHDLPTLIQTLLDHTDVERLRLSSLEPWTLDHDFFDLWQNPRLCRQLHLPLQAGCDATLRRMGRPVTTARFRRLIETAQAAIPGLAVTTDVIAGFPGEDDAAFQASYDFVAGIPFARIHVFPYSPRPGTPAVRLSDQVDRATRRARARTMRKLGQRQARAFRQQFIGHDMLVLWERGRHQGLQVGLTDNYLRVATRAEGDLHNQVTATRLLSARDGLVRGEIIE